MNPSPTLKLSTLVVLLSATGAFAQESATPPAGIEAHHVDDDTQHRFSLTFSPLHLALPLAVGPSSTPFVELTGEFRVADKAGIAITLGGGQMLGAFVGEVAGQARYYILGSFIHGMSLGLEAGYAGVNAVFNSPQGSVVGFGNGFTVSPLLGYKIATNMGFTFDVQAGPSLLFAQAVASNDGTVQRASLGPSLVPNVNLNVGWSF